jgi:hypothetical protein
MYINQFTVSSGFSSVEISRHGIVGLCKILSMGSSGEVKQTNNGHERDDHQRKEKTAHVHDIKKDWRTSVAK